MSHPTLLLHTNYPEKSLTDHIPFKNKNSNPDLIWINKEEPDITIEKVRSIQTHLTTRPYQEDRKILILLDIDQANLPAQNALLKSLEEPPEHIQFLLTTAHPELLLATIRSRCIIVKTEGKGTGEKLEIPDINTLTVTEKIQLVEKIAKEKNHMPVMYQLLEQKKEQFEKNPNKQLITEIRAIQKTITMLQANTNTKLCLEWCFFQL